MSRFARWHVLNANVFHGVSASVARSHGSHECSSLVLSSEGSLLVLWEYRTVGDTLRFTLYIAEPQYEHFQELAAERGQPYSELIRQALNQYLRKQETLSRRTLPGRKQAYTRKRP